ncbi:hypothetical protein ACLOJK_021355 [Asimina triloba]
MTAIQQQIQSSSNAENENPQRTTPQMATNLRSVGNQGNQRWQRMNPIAARWATSDHDQQGRPNQIRQATIDVNTTTSVSTSNTAMRLHLDRGMSATAISTVD